MRSEAACVGPSIVVFTGARGRAEGGQDVMRERSGHTGARGVWCGDGRNQEMRKGPEAVGADERHGTHLATPCAFSLLTLWPSMSIDVLCVKSIRKHRELWETRSNGKFTEIGFPGFQRMMISRSNRGRKRQVRDRASRICTGRHGVTRSTFCGILFVRLAACTTVTHTIWV